MERYILENRWQIKDNKLVFYGIRRAPYINKNNLQLSKRKMLILQSFINSNQEVVPKFISNLIKQGILVEETQKKKTPKTLEEAIFCTNCIANDFIIPGLEFKDGLCPMCATESQKKHLVATLPVKQVFNKAKKSRFDVAVFYTGGKDSTYLLYYFANVLKIRVLALTWEIPFMSDNARKSIENAKQKLRNVEFVNRYVAPEDLNKMYKKLLELQNNTCACPSLAYALFYPTLVTERIPYLVLGNEPVQMLGLYYNNMAPEIAYRFQDMKLVRILMNIGRLFLLKKPLRNGQIEMHMLIKQLVYGDSWIKKMSGYQNELINNICIAMKEITDLNHSLKKTIRYANRRALMPSLVHFDMNQADENGIYNWRKIIKTIIEETGWVPPEDDHKALHTSCCVEIAKDYSQFIRFYNMETTVIPFSALEISLASAKGNYSKEEAIKELKQNLGFTLEQPDSHKIMIKCDGCRIKRDLK